MSFISNSSRYNRNMFPDYIYYGASEKLAAQYESTYSGIVSKSNLSLENQYVLNNLDGKHDQTHSAQHDIKQKLQGINESQSQENKEVKRLQEELAQANQNIMLIMQMLQKNHLQTTQQQETMDVQYSERQDPQPGGSLHQDPRAEDQQLSNSRPNSRTSDHTSDGGFASGSMSSIFHTRSASKGQVKYSAEHPLYPDVHDREDISIHSYDGDDDDHYDYSPNPESHTQSRVEGSHDGKRWSLFNKQGKPEKSEKLRRLESVEE
jgi:hypothetical protein